jgi:hypothetical protein
MFQRLNKFLSGLEWRWSLGAAVWGVLFPATSFALPAWATRAAGMFSEYAPLSWVVAGFLGLMAYALAVFFYGTGQQRSVRSRYDARFMIETGGVDPLARVFESKRIYLNDFVLPSQARVFGKTFVDCEIVGPANIYFETGNSVDDVQLGQVDAVSLNGERQFYNGILFRDCKFRGCTFHRVTLFFQPSEALLLEGLNWLNWISPMPSNKLIAAQDKPSLIEGRSDQLQPGSATETPP